MGEVNIWLIVGVVAIVIGVWLIVKMVRSSSATIDKNNDVAHKNGLPITPRDEREFARTEPNEEPNEPTPVQTDATDALSNMAAVATASPMTAQTDDLADGGVKPHTETPPMRDLNQGFGQNSPMLDKHLEGQQIFDQNNDPILHAQDTITIMINPKNRFEGVSGKTVLSLVREHGLKYGVMNMFHRYENENGTGDLWFSVMGINEEGIQPFDLNVIAESRFTGLALFLSLPHPHALRGFDSMAAVAQMVAAELNADLSDEAGYLLGDVDFAKMRAIAANYQ